MLFTNYSMNRDFNKWKIHTEKGLQQEEKLEKEKYASKMDSLNKVIERQPENYEALVERGLMKRHKRQDEASIDDYKKALEIKPDDFKANLEMGYSLGLLGKKEQRDSFYRIAARLDTSSYFAKSHPEYLEEK
jgi:tetratricopeptide (TPR) repeat protein